VQVVVVVDERHDDVTRAFERQARADIDRYGARRDEQVEQVLGEREVDLGG